MTTKTIEDDKGMLLMDEDSVDSHVHEEDEERDEVQEIQRQARGDNSRVCLGRTLATGALIVTAIVVTWTTFAVLKQEEKDDFETAVRIQNQIDPLRDVSYG